MDGVVLTTLATTLDPGVASGHEVYQCYRFDAGGAAGAAIHALQWRPPSGSIALHHAMMFATGGEAEAGRVPCDPTPAPIAVLPLYAPGAERTAFAPGVSISIPDSATAFFVELHLLRLDEGSSTLELDLLASEEAPEHLAGWVDDTAPVPSIEPHASASSTGRCGFEAEAHVVASWPHMHRSGSSFRGTVIRADGDREGLVEVETWDFAHQPLYPVEAVVQPGDEVETECSWFNSTDVTVTGGAWSHDEMCNQGLVIWPIEAARCVR
jgi:hypothetical protein